MSSGLWFFGVAAAAGLTHLAVFFLIEYFLPSVLPEIANFLAFSVAFSISFMGHRNLSFSDTTSSVEQSLRRFVVVSVAGILIGLLIGYSHPLFRQFVRSTKTGLRIGNGSLSSLCKDRYAVG